MSVFAPEEDNHGRKKFKKPFLCFFCRGVIGYSTPYFRMPHPLGDANKTQPRYAYLHADGASCVSAGWYWRSMSSRLETSTGQRRV